MALATPRSQPTVTKRVLVVSYFYPPFSSVGATRVSKMTKYLADAGWEAHVLTVDRCDLPATLPIEIPESHVIRAPQAFDLAAIPRAVLGRRRIASGRMLPTTGWRSSLLWRLGEVYRHLLCFPDAQVGWYAGAVAAGSAAIERIRPDIILSSSLPNTAHLVARSLARKSGLPWVAELRDLWTENHNFRRFAPLRIVERHLERAVLSEADALVTVSEILGDWLREQYHRPTFVVPNGYDPADYPSTVAPNTEVFSLVYTGMFYNGKQSADTLFEAVARLSAAGRIRPERFRLHFVGQYLGPVLEHAAAFGVDPFVTVAPPISHHDALRLQREASALLVLDFNDARSGYYSAKIFEYLGAARPILSLGAHDSLVAQLLATSRAGVTASCATEVENVLLQWLAEFERTGTIAYCADETIRRKYQRQNGAREIAAILNRSLA